MTCVNKVNKNKFPISDTPFVPVLMTLTISTNWQQQMILISLEPNFLKPCQQGV